MDELVEDWLIGLGDRKLVGWLYGWLNGWLVGWLLVCWIEGWLVS